MKFSDFHIVCQMPDCHGRVIPRNPKWITRGVCQKCGMDTDEFKRLYRPDEWKAEQQANYEKAKALLDATCGHVKIKITE